MRQLDKGESVVVSGKYIGKTMCGFVNSEEYCIKISRELYGYTVASVDEIDVGGFLNYSCMNSIEKNWELAESE